MRIYGLRSAIYESEGRGKAGESFVAGGMADEGRSEALSESKKRKSEGKHMTKTEMKHRTKEYAKRVVRVCEALSNNWVARTLGMQLLRCGTSVGCNCRAVCRAKSTADFLNKLKIVEEECDESLFWMEILIEGGFVAEGRLQRLMQKGNELLAIIVAGAKTTRAGSDRRSPA